MPVLRLNPHPKALFLIHRGNKMFNTPLDELAPASGFFKCLLISRQFLRASQMYRVYHFIIHEFCDNHKFNIDLSIWRIGGWCTRKFQLTLEEIRRLNQLLNVQYIDVFAYCYNHADEYSDLCKIFKGRIALCFWPAQGENELHHYVILKQIKSQLYSLRCNARSLLESSEVPRLDLIYCALLRCDNFYQVKQALTNHRIRKMAICNFHRHSHPRFDETIDSDYFVDFPICPRIKKLSFDLDQLDETHDIVSKLSKMVSFFPNLTEIACDFRAEHYTSEQFSLQRLVTWIEREGRKTEYLRKACPSTTSVRLYYMFRIRRPESINTVKQMVKQILKKTKFKQLYCFEHITKEAEDEDVVLVRQYYYVNVVWKEPNICSALRFTVDLDPLTLDDNEVIEEDDNLLIPRFTRYS